MDLHDADVTVECPSMTAVLTLLGIPVVIAVVMMFLAGMGIATFLLARKFDLEIFLAAYLFPALTALMSWALWAVLRYRESLFTTIRVSTSGVVVQNSRYGVLLLPWEELRATYIRVGRMVILEASRLTGRWPS
jgi:hypothetical protein